MFGFFQLSLLFCHNDVQKKKKQENINWRGNPREATGLIRNGLPQLKYYNKILTEYYQNYTCSC